MSIICLLFSIKSARKQCKISDGPAISIFHISIKGSSAAVLSMCGCLKLTTSSNTSRATLKLLRIHMEAVTYLFQTDPIEKVKKETDADLTGYTNRGTCCRRKSRNPLLQNYFDARRYLINLFWERLSLRIYIYLSATVCYATVSRMSAQWFKILSVMRRSFVHSRSAHMAT